MSLGTVLTWECILVRGTELLGVMLRSAGICVWRGQPAAATEQRPARRCMPVAPPARPRRQRQRHCPPACQACLQALGPTTGWGGVPCLFRWRARLRSWLQRQRARRPRCPLRTLACRSRCAVLSLVGPWAGLGGVEEEESAPQMLCIVDVSAGPTRGPWPRLPTLGTPLIKVLPLTEGLHLASTCQTSLARSFIPSHLAAPLIAAGRHATAVQRWPSCQGWPPGHTHP
jgi:hypothetical protein